MFFGLFIFKILKFQRIIWHKWKHFHSALQRHRRDCFRRPSGTPLPFTVRTFKLSFSSDSEICIIRSGHAFSVIQSSSGGPPNYINPPRRDTALTSGSPAAPLRIRFRTDNPGPWFLHCHIDWHLGMVFDFIWLKAHLVLLFLQRLVWQPYSLKILQVYAVDRNLSIPIKHGKSFAIYIINYLNLRNKSVFSEVSCSGLWI